MLLKSRRPTHTAMEEFAPDDFDEREKHQRRQRQRDQKVLRLPDPAPPAGRGRGGLTRRVIDNRFFDGHCWFQFAFRLRLSTASF